MQSLEELQEAASHFAQMRKRQRHETLTTQPSLDSDDHHHTPLPGRPQRQQVRSQPQQPGPPLAHSPREIAAAANPVSPRPRLQLLGMPSDPALADDRQRPTHHTGYGTTGAVDSGNGNGNGALHERSRSDGAALQASDPGTPAPSQRGLAAAGMQDPQGQEVQPMTHQGVDSDHAGQAGPWMQITDPAAGPFSSASRRRTGLRHAIVKALYKGWMDYNSLVWREYLGLVRPLSRGTCTQAHRARHQLREACCPSRLAGVPTCQSCVVDPSTLLGGVDGPLKRLLPLTQPTSC